MNYPSQKKILQPLLKSPKNSTCADCSVTSPTWASLDFGVFICSDCSGAHRALGPTITRVKSATLDLWQEQWLDCMLIGNDELNQYWEADVRCYQKKPKWGASNQDIQRYVYEKYVKKKYVKDSSVPDPLTAYKQSKRDKGNKKLQQKQAISKPQMTLSPKRQPPSSTKSQRDPSPPPMLPTTLSKKQPQPDLISFQMDIVNPQPMTSIVQPRQPLLHLNHPSSASPEQSQRTSRPEHGTSFTTQNSVDNFISFQDMINMNNKVPNTLSHSLSSQNTHRPTFTIPHINHNHQTNQLGVNNGQYYHQHQQFQHSHLLHQQQQQYNHQNGYNNYNQAQYGNQYQQYKMCNSNNNQFNWS